MKRLLATLLLTCATLPGAARGSEGEAAAGPKPVVAAPRIVLAARSIGSRRGDPPSPKAHAALLVRLGSGPGGFIVQGGKESVSGWLPGRARVIGYVIPCADPALEFTRAAGAFWGEGEVRELPTRALATFDEPGLTEARIRAIVDSLNEEFRSRDYRLDGGPSSNSFVSRFLERLGRALPAVGDADLPGWGWRP
ncbi:MAG: hypothetical protein WCK73_05500 [Deltaproteobacteria bacterium]